jgi:hypothetical protein
MNQKIKQLIHTFKPLNKWFFNFTMNNRYTAFLRIYAACGAFTLFICYHLRPEYGVIIYFLQIVRLTGVILYFFLNSIRDFRNQQIGFKPLYAILVVDAFLNLAVFFVGVQRPPITWVIIIIQTIISWYFIINDYYEVAKEK